MAKKTMTVTDTRRMDLIQKAIEARKALEIFLDSSSHGMTFEMTQAKEDAYRDEIINTSEVLTQEEKAFVHQLFTRWQIKYAN